MHRFCLTMGLLVALCAGVMVTLAASMLPTGLDPLARADLHSQGR